MMVTDSEFHALQKLVMGDMRQIFTETVIDHAVNPRHVGSMSDADGFAMVRSNCGENMEIWLRVKDDCIKDIRFWSDGCGATVACGSMVTELAIGKTTTGTLNIGKQDIIDPFGMLPEGNVHCAALAVKTLQKAVRNYLVRHKELGKSK